MSTLGATYRQRRAQRDAERRLKNRRRHWYEREVRERYAQLSARAT